MIGPGKYDDVCTSVREQLLADGVILIVFGGVRGPGFSGQLPPHLSVAIPDILRSVANQIENGERATTA